MVDQEIFGKQTFHRGKRNFGDGFEMMERIEELERALRRLEYWLDTDQEILDAMEENERRVHLEMLRIARAALTGENG